MTLITRRAALGGFVAFPTLAVPNAHVPDGNMMPSHHPEFSPEFSDKCLRMAFLLGGMSPTDRELVLQAFEAEIDGGEVRAAS
jgi:hypothetical protein